MLEKISFEQFQKVDLRVGKVLRAEGVAGSEKLLRLEIDLGEERRQILAGLAVSYAAEELVGQSVIIVANLEPRKIMGLESQGMLLCADTSEKPVCLTVLSEVLPGTRVR
jgi:methionine--tRNA ligase beta chain